MKRILAVIALAAAGIMLVAGCGGGDGNGETEVKAINALVAELNRVTSEKDATGFCDVMQPSGLKAAFNTKQRCVQETTKILKEAGKQPVLTVDSISVDGDQALVKFKDRNGEAPLVKEDGKWYVPLDLNPAEATGTGSESADADSSDSPDADTGDGN